MKPKIYTYFYLICSLILTNYSVAQSTTTEERGKDWSICDAAITKYNSQMSEILAYTTNLMIEVSGLPNPNDNPALFAYDTGQYFSTFAEPSATDAFDAIRAAAEIEEKLNEIDRLMFIAMDGVAESFLNAIEGKDC
jgi:hypothetical protein